MTLDPEDEDNVIFKGLFFIALFSTGVVFGYAFGLAFYGGMKC